MANVLLDVIGSSQISVTVADGTIPALVLTAPSVIQLGITVPGVQGPPGAGIPAGGSQSQILLKNSNISYDTGWATLIAGANVSITSTTGVISISTNGDGLSSFLLMGA